MNTKIIVFGLVLVLLLSGIVGIASAFSNSGGGDWKYYKEVTIKEKSGKTLTDYQVLVQLNPSNFPTDANSDGSDIRLSVANTNELNYWIENWDYNAKKAKIWVKVPSIPANDETKIRMYYGNENASAVSEGNKVFAFFDDFEDGDDFGWGHEIGSWIVSNGEYTATGKSGLAGSSVGSISWTDYIFEGDLRITQKGAAHLGLRVHEVGVSSNDLPNGIVLVIFPSGNSIYWHVRENWIGDPQGIKNLDVSVNRPIHVKVEIAGDTYKAYVNGILKNTLDDNTYSSGKIAVCVNLNYPTPTTWDNILVRKYTLPEPTLTIGEKTANQEIILNLINSVSTKIDALKRKNVDTSLIEQALSKAKDSYEYEKYGEAIEIVENAQKMADDAYKVLSEYVEPAQSEIDDAKLIGADVRDAESKLKDAKDALNKGNYEYAKSWAGDASGLAKHASVGSVQIKDLKALATKYDQRTVIISGTIRDIETVYGEGYKFALDDGTGMISVVYRSGLGDIQEGDKITVNGMFEASSRAVAAENVKKAWVSSVPGFEAIFAIAGLLAVTYLLRRRK